MNKYENYYPIYSCFEGKKISLLKEPQTYSYLNVQLFKYKSLKTIP